MSTLTGTGSPSSSGVISAQAAQEFITKWGPGGPAFELGERAGAQTHFVELCQLLGVPTPGEAERYCFERGVTKTGTGSGRTDGFADVWLKGHFAWEYKAPGKSLDAALKQLMMYALPLENPPLLVVSDRLRIEVHTHFTGTPSERHDFPLVDLGRHDVQQRLRALWLAPDSFKPRKTNRDITEEAARTFAGTADRMRAAGVPAEEVSHFLTQCLFCFFSEDVGLLPERLFERLVGVNVNADRMRTQLAALFETMRTGGLFGVDDIPWFNGGLFKPGTLPPLAAADVAALKAASALNWSAIDPSIFGTLFERGLDPAVRSQLGANYTDPATILRVIEPVIQLPLLAEWAALVPTIQAALERSKKLGDKAYRDAQAVFVGFLERLKNFRVLDPACGSGNFLYLSLKCLKDIEHQVNIEAEAMGLQRQHDVTGPHNVLGLELNEFAAELARVTIWIGELQWRIQRGYGFKLNPVLEPLEHIQCRDAVLNADGTRARWPRADVVVGNPPFVGNKKMRTELGATYTERLRAAYEGHVSGGADLVCYWFEMARQYIGHGSLERAGLVSTSSIRSGPNREVLDQIGQTTRIFEAWSEQPWVNDGAAVEVSLIAFGNGSVKPRLDGVEVEAIHADLTADIDVTKAPKLPQNLGRSFQGVTPSAAVKKALREKLGLPDASFNLKGDEARKILKEPATIDGEPMAAVVRPYLIADDITSRPLDRFIVNFVGRDERAAAMFEKPFAAIANVRLHRPHTDRFNDFEKFPWWHFGWPRPDMFAALKGLSRFISITRVSKHHLCAWTPSAVTPGDALVVVARDDDTTIGVLQSRIHEVWSLRRGSSLEDRPRYTHTSCFETFPFPDGLTPDILASAYADNEKAQAISKAAQTLFALREHYLNPQEWTDLVISPEEAAAGFPRRPVAKPGRETDLKMRTLTNLYNARPAWLAHAHEALDVAVAAAYGWTDYKPAMPDAEVLRRLLKLNLARAAG